MTGIFIISAASRHNRKERIICDYWQAEGEGNP